MYTTSGGLSETQRERICSLIFGPECSIIFTSGYSFSKSAKTSFHHESPYPPTKYCISRSPDILPSEVSVSLLLLFVLSLLLLLFSLGEFSLVPHALRTKINPIKMTKLLSRLFLLFKILPPH